jgi:carbon storage regulator
MLVLSRKTNESILIDGGIRVKVIAVHGSTVRLGIEAPRSVGVFREEIYVDAGHGADEDSNWEPADLVQPARQGPLPRRI